MLQMLQWKISIITITIGTIIFLVGQAKESDHVAGSRLEIAKPYSRAAIIFFITSALLVVWGLIVKFG